MFHVEPSNQAIRMACPKDHLVTKKNFEVWLDPDTQIAQTKPRPDEEHLSSYYVSEEYISHTDTRKTLVEKTYALVQRIMFFKKSKWIRTFLSAEKAYLDFGCGTGAFVGYLQELGWKAFGVEPNEKARKVYNNPNIVDSLDKIVEDSFDCIALWHVLEHLSQPKSTLQKLIPLLTEKQRQNLRPIDNPPANREVSIVIRKDFVKERMINAVADGIKAIIPEELLDNRLKKFRIKL